MPGSSRKVARVAIAAVAVAAALVATFAVIADRLAERSIEAASEDALRRGARSFTTLERHAVENLSTQLDALLDRPETLALYQARDRDKLVAWAAPIFRQLRLKHGVTHWYFLDPEPARTCFLRVHAPALHDDVVNRDTFTQAIATHDIGYGKELGKTAFALRVVKPLRAGGAIVGYVELGEEIDHFLESMKQETGDDFGVLVQKARLDRAELRRVRGEDRWNEHADVVLVDSTVWNERMIEPGVPVAQLPPDGKMLGEWTDGSRTFVGGAFPLRNAAGDVVGALFVRHEITAVHGKIEASRRRALSIAGAVALALGAVGIVLARGRATE